MKNSVLFYINYIKGHQSYRAKYFKLAQIYFNQALIYNPRHPKCNFKLGMSYFKQELWEEAALWIGKSLELEPSNKQWKNQLIQAQRKNGKNIKSINSLEKENRIRESIEKNPKNPNLYFELSLVLNKQAKWWQEIEAIKKATELDPSQSDWFYALGMAQEKMNRFEEASQSIKNAIGLKTDDINAQWYYKLGFNYEKSGNTVESQNTYNKAIEHDNELKSNLFGIGVFHQKHGLWQEACKAYEERLKEIPLDDELCYKCGMAYDRLYDWENAIKYYQVAINLNTTIAYRYYRLGFVYERISDYDKASQNYQKAIERSNDHKPEWHYRLGYCLQKLGDFQKACEAYQDMRILKKPYGVSEDKFNKDAGFRQAAIYTEFYEELHIKDKTILYESFHGASMSCNPYAIFLYLLEQEEFKDYTHIWVVNDTSKVSQRFKEMENVIFVKRDSYLYMRYLASVKYLINNNTFPPYFIRKDEQKYLNTWHGTPWKTLGKDIKTNNFEHKNVARNLLHSTHFISPNKHTTYVMIDRHDIKDLINAEVIETGYPRIDLTLNINLSKTEYIKKQLGIERSKKVVLYAPTYRGSSLGIDSADNEIIEQLLMELSKLNDYHILFRGHHMTEKFLNTSNLKADIVPSSIDSNELLGIVDILITDYSSIAFDFLCMKKPIIYFAYDYEKYANERGLYFDIESMAGNVCYEQSEVIETINKLDRNQILINYENQLKTFAPYDDGNSSERVCNIFFKNKIINSVNLSINKHNILVYAGALMLNGITVSLKNLISLADNKRYSFNVAIDEKSIFSSDERKEQMELLKNDVNFIARVGRINYTIEEEWLNSKFLDQHQLNMNEMNIILRSAYKREFKRMYGDSKIKTVVNFEGYVRFWALLFAFGNPYNSKNIIYLHNDMLGEFKERFPTQESVFNVYNEYDKLISVSKSTNEENRYHLIPKYKIEQQKFDYADNLLNPELVIESAKEDIADQEIVKIINSAKPLFVNMARLSVEKGHTQLIKAFKSIVASNPKAKLIILGDGPLRNDLNILIRELNLEENVFLIGSKSNPFPYLAKADCFVFSSKHEGQGLVLLESMILNKPIICTDFPCAYDVLEDGKYGLLVENSSEGLFEGMKEYLNGNINQEKFDYDAYNKNALESFYNKVCGEKF